MKVPFVVRRSSFVVSFVVPFLVSVAVAQPRDEDRRFRLAEGYERAGDMRGAARVYRELLDADTTSALYFEGVRRTYGALGMYAELLPLVESRLSRTPGDYELRVTLAELLFRTGKREEARAAWQQAVVSGNQQEFVAALVAQSQTDVRAFDLAIDTYRMARERSGDRLLFADQLGFLFASVGRYAEATREYMAILGGDPSRITVVKRSMAAIVANPTGLEAATKDLEAATTRNPDFEPYLDLLSWLYDEARNFEGAFEVARRLDRARNGKGSSIYAYADRALRERRYDAALKALDYFLATYGRDNPLHSIALLTYARVLEERHRAVGAGDADALVERYESLAASEKGTEVAAEALLRKARVEAEDLDDPDAAAATLEELIAAPNNRRVVGDALVALGELRLRAGDLSAAAELFERAAASAPVDDDDAVDVARLRRAEIALYRGEYRMAVDSLTELTRNTSSGVANDALGWLFLLQENFERNDAALDHFMAGRLALLRHVWSDAAERFSKAIAAAPRTTLADQAVLLRAEAQSRLGEHSAAVEALVAFVGGTPDAIAADRALFRAAEIVDRHLATPARALELYTRLLTEYPRSHHAPAARARVRELRTNP